MENKFKFLTKYSLNKKIKNKWFLIINIILLVVIIGIANIDNIVKYFGGDFNKDTKIKIVDNANYYDVIENSIKSTAEYVDSSKYIITKVKNLDKQKKKIEGKKDIILVINKDEENIFNVEFITDTYVDMVKYQVVSSSLNSAKQSIAMSNSNIDKEELAKIQKEVEIKRSFINESKTKEEEDSKNILSILSVVIVFPCFMLIIFLVQMIGAEINEEKSSRSMEIIIGNVPVKTHFFSKVLASNVFVLMQGGLLLIYGALGMFVRKLLTPENNSMVSSALNELDIQGSIDLLLHSEIMDKLGYVIPLILILLILSFVAYSLVAGILASMTTNMENYQQLQTPIMVISVIGYYLIFLSVAFPGSIFIKVVSCIPFLSITVAPSLLISGEINVIVIIIAILLIALTDYLLIKFGFRIYKEGILNYRETDLWKRMFKAIKQK